jgi:hypothetical protein
MVHVLWVHGKNALGIVTAEAARRNVRPWNAAVVDGGREATRRTDCTGTDAWIYLSETMLNPQRVKTAQSEV